MDYKLWTITRTDTDEHTIGSSNTIFTACNGYLSLRGNLLENRSGAYPCTFINGLFDEADMVGFIRPTKYERRYLDPEYFDTATSSPSIANLPNPLLVRAFVDDREISFRRGEVTGFKQEYDLYEGVYSYEYDYKDSAGKTTHIRMERFCDMCSPHRAVVRYCLTPLNYSGRITIHSGIDGTIRSNLQRDKQFAVLSADGDSDNRCFLKARTFARGIDVNIATANILPTEGRVVVEDEAVYDVFELNARQGEAITMDKLIVLSSSEDSRYGVEIDAAQELEELAKAGFDRVRQANREWWKEVWDRIDVRIEGDELSQLYLRFCLYHLMMAAPRHTDKLSVPCKLVTGEHYQGTTFYDTDLYTETFYLYAYPQIAKSCLNHRYLGLDHGRQIAKDLGFKGAKFAWQAGPYGEEALGKWWQFTHTNIHIDGDVAYSLMRYFHATGDIRFMIEKGIDILIESSRFYTSRATYDARNDRYDLTNVAGPDEGHCESKNNYYTNLLAKKTLSWTADMLDLLARDHAADYREVKNRLSISPDETSVWRIVSDKLTFYFDPATKVYEQCDGFYKLDPIPTDLLNGRKAWFVTVFPYQALNQPDVVMAQVLLSHEFPEDIKRANWEFYKDKSMNFSSMSFVINSMMASNLGELPYAYDQFFISAGEDVDENLTGRKDTSDGIHGTASGGAWMAAVLGFGGISMVADGLMVNPRLPEKWKSLKFNLVLKGEVLSFDIDRTRLKVSVGNTCGVEISATIAGKQVNLTSGSTIEVSLL